MPTPLHLDHPLNSGNGEPLTGRRLLHLAADAVESITPADAPTREQVTQQLASVRRVTARPSASSRATTVTTRELATLTAVLEQAAHHWNATYLHDEPPTAELAQARRLTALADDPEDVSLDYVMFVMLQR